MKTARVAGRRAAPIDTASRQNLQSKEKNLDELADWVALQLYEHGAVWDLVDTVAQVFSDRIGSMERAPADGLWEGLRVISQRMSDEAAQLQGQVEEIQRLAGAQAGKAGAR